MVPDPANPDIQKYVILDPVPIPDDIDLPALEPPESWIPDVLINNPTHYSIIPPDNGDPYNTHIRKMRVNRFLQREQKIKRCMPGVRVSIAKRDEIDPRLLLRQSPLGEALKQAHTAERRRMRSLLEAARLQSPDLWDPKLNTLI